CTGANTASWAKSCAANPPKDRPFQTAWKAVPTNMSATVAPVKEAAKPAFQQRLGLFDSTMLVAGTMIGSGIFITSVEISQNVGTAGWLLAVWAVAGLMTIIGALSYAELAAMMPQAGGQYVYLREAYSPMWGFLYGWTCFLVIQTGSIAAVGVAFAKFLGVFFPALGTDAALPTQELVKKGLASAVPNVVGFFPSLGGSPETSHATIIFAATNVNVSLKLPIMGEFFRMDHFVVTAGQLVAVVVIGLLSLLNCRGVQEGKIVQNLFTIAKTLGLIALIFVGLVLVSNPTA